MFPLFHCYALKEMGLFNHKDVIYTLLPDIDHVVFKKDIIHEGDIERIKDKDLKKDIQLHLLLDQLSENNFILKKSKIFERPYVRAFLEVYYDQIIAQKDKRLLEDVIEIVDSLSEDEIRVISQNLNLKMDDIKSYYKKISKYLRFLNCLRHVPLPKDSDVENFFKIYKVKSSKYIV